MEPIVIDIELTIGNDVKITGVKINRVTDGQGNCITVKFYQYCQHKNLPISTQQEIEIAAESFVKNNESWLL